MISLPQALKDWKAGDGQVSPVAVLYDIVITDAITLRLVEGNPTGGSITYDGNVYLPSSIRREDVDQSIEGEIGSFRLGISNKDGIAGGYIERYELEGNQVTITTVPVESLNPADAFVETYTIQDRFYDRDVAAVTLGYSNLFKRKIPWRRYQRVRCLWDWENRYTVGNGCGFPSDEFEDDTQQSFTIGASTNSEHKRRFGWYTINMVKEPGAVAAGVTPPPGVIADSDITALSNLYIETTASGVNWAGTSRDGPFVYKKITGDFDVNTKVDPVNFREQGLMGVLCQEDNDGDSWVYLARTRLVADESIKIVVRASIDGSVEASTSVAQPDPRYLRMRRVGDVFSLYYRLNVTDAWTLIEDRTIAMTPEIRIGLAIAGGTGLSLAAAFDFFRFTAGGPQTCDRTKEGADGCRAKDRIHRIFLFDGIPRR